MALNNEIDDFSEISQLNNIDPDAQHHNIFSLENGSLYYSIDDFMNKLANVIFPCP